MCSPVPSETNASLVLTCGSPTSASIDIVDHHGDSLNENFSTVLHFNEKKPSMENQSSQGDCKQGDQDVEVAQTPPTPRNESSESEAAAIKIQSAFRGYRTRKNSPYRTRSPQTAASKRIALRQKEATILSQDMGDDTNAELDDESGEQVVNVGETRRSSRARRLDSSPTAIVGQDAADPNPDEPAPTGITGSISIEEFTNTDDATTVKATTQHQQHDSNIHSVQLNPEEAKDSAAQDAFKIEPSAIADSRQVTDDLTAHLDGCSSSLDFRQDPTRSDTLEEQGLSAALETQSTANQFDDIMLEALQLSNRPSIGSKSEASVELDTDSSVLGAALSLTNDDISSSTNAAPVSATIETSDTPLSDQTTTQHLGGAALAALDEDKSLGTDRVDEFEREARRLVDEMTADELLAGDEDQEVTSNDQAGELSTANQQLEAALVEDADDEGEGEVSNLEGEQALDEEEKLRMIELELNSDDIERRDPSGQVSEERALSPQIKADDLQPSFQDQSEDRLIQEDENVEVAATIGNNGLANLTVESPTSGRSSPGLNSSVASSNEDEDEQDDDANNPDLDAQTKLQSETPNQSSNGKTSRNKNRRNNRKKKGKK